MKPLIGITPSCDADKAPHGEFRRYTLSDTYPRAIEAAGGVPVILPLSSDDQASLLDRLDGVVFSGGGDINPEYWHEDRHKEAYGIDRERDSYEIALVRAAVDRRLPMLGICRGLQIINVALGGSLIQDIPSQHESTIQHSQHKSGLMRDERSHEVTFAEGARLAEIVGAGSMRVNSFHHQAVRDLAPGLVLEATAADGLVEAFRLPDLPFGLATQWHPEMLQAQFDEHAKIFRAFITAAAGLASR